MGEQRILIIEDSADGAEALALLLRADNHTIVIASSGTEGLEAAHRLRPHVVLCDIHLAGKLDGFAVARAIKSDPSLREALVVGLSGQAEPGISSRARDAGFDRYLFKPADPAEILRLVAQPERRD